MSTTTLARPRVAMTDHAPFRALARIEAGRMLRHPAPWVGVLLWAGTNALTLTSPPRWPTAQYQELTVSMTFLLLGVSVASAYVFGRARTEVAEEAPMPVEQQALARLVGGLALVGLVAVVVGVGALWLRLSGGVALGVEPGRTAHAHFTLGEILQPVAAALFAVALGAAVVRIVRHPLAASIAVVVLWFVTGPAYWVVNGPVLRWLTPVQVLPLEVEVAPLGADPATLPSDWLLQSPGEFAPYWGRILVVPELAAWHDVYLVGLALLVAAVAVPGRSRRVLAGAGAVVGAVGVVMQAGVTP